MVSPAEKRLAAAKAAIASACLDALPPAALGKVVLRDDQRLIAARAQRLLERHGGCLIAEDVGRGKTFVALALARQWRHPLVIIPAALRSTWERAASSAEVECVIHTHDALSRRSLPASEFDGLIVDESHHFRTTTTRRYAALAELAVRAPVVLLSATPLQNRSRDLAAQLALFIGSSAHTLGAAQLARFVVRGEAAQVAGMPDVLAPEWRGAGGSDQDVLDALLALPAPPRPEDGGDAGALRQLLLVRAWASSRAALRGVLRTRTRVVTAIEQALDEGRLPTRRELRAWHAVGSDVQLGFASLLAPACTARDSSALRAQVENERSALASVAAALKASEDPDTSRAHELRMLRTEFPGERILVFSEYATTVQAFFRLLRADAGVGMLTASEARIASGKVPRHELLARFAPHAQESRVFPPHQGVTLLLATDLLSEGVNLQDASIVVHLDLPWNPARLAQRVGRVRRPGREVSRVRTFFIAPPVPSRSLLDLETRLRRKLDLTRTTIGPGFALLPGPHDTTSTHLGGATQLGAIAETLSRWRAAGNGESRADIVTAGVKSDSRGWLAALADGRIVACIAGAINDDPQHVLNAVRHCLGRAHAPREIGLAGSEANAWLERDQLAEASGLAHEVSPFTRSLSRALTCAVATSRRHDRATVVNHATRLRTIIASPIPVGLEARLLEFTQGNTPIRAGALAAMLALSETSHAARHLLPQQARDNRIVALIELQVEEP